MPARLNPETGRGYRFKDRTGQRNGRLTFTRHVGVNRHGQNIWEALCDCGRTTQITAATAIRSCGCLQRETAAETQRKKALPPAIKAANVRASRAKQRKRRKADPLVVLQARLSRLHRHALRQVGAIKTSPTFEELGYSVEAFVVHIARQFKRGMGWHNTGEWQVDHIVPISTAKTKDDVIALNQLSNLRPMWSRANNAKKNRRENLI